MPHRIIRMSKHQPTRAILLVIALFTLGMTIFTVTPWYGPPEVSVILGEIGVNLWNVIPVIGAGLFGLFATITGHEKYMRVFSFLMFFIWLFSALNRILLIVHPWQILWVPFVIIALISGICYLHIRSIERGRDE